MYKIGWINSQKNSETINAKEWMRICFDLLEMLKPNVKEYVLQLIIHSAILPKLLDPKM